MKEFDVIIKDLYSKFNEYGGELSIAYGKPYKEIAEIMESYVRLRF